MSQSTLSRELALAIGLAARALPDITPAQLVSVLIGCIGVPITAENLAQLKLQQYKKALNRNLQTSFSTAQVQPSYDCLQYSRNSGQHQTLSLQAYQRGDMPHSIRVAVASQQGVYIDGQFSQCNQFYIFQVSAVEVRLIMIRSANTKEALTAEQKMQYRAQLIEDCNVLYSHSISAQAAARVIKFGVHPIKLTHIAQASTIIEQLQHVLSTSPPPWLAKTMGIESAIQQPSLLGETV